MPITAKYVTVQGSRDVSQRFDSRLRFFEILD